jgi:AcrR family transcriptional regulator
VSRREQILDAATRLFSAYGFKKTSVDDVASEAGISKPTLYAYFEDKEALFSSVCDRVLLRLHEDTKKAAAGKGPIEDVVADLLAAKFTTLFELVDRHPHARELIESSERIGADKVEKADAEFRGLLTQILRTAVKKGHMTLRSDTKLSELVDVLIQCGHGASNTVEDSTAHRAQLRRSVKLVLFGASRR